METMMWPMVPIKNLMDRVEQSTSNDEQVRGPDKGTVKWVFLTALLMAIVADPWHFGTDQDPDSWNHASE